MSDPRVHAGRDWVYVGVLTVLGLVLIWWAGEQLTGVLEVAGSEFRFPRIDLLLYLLTLVAAGVVLGLATASETRTAPLRRRAIAGWSLLPLFGVVAFYTTRGFGWPEGPWMNVNVIVVLTNIHVGSALVFGFFVSRLVATPSRQQVEE